MFVEKKIETVVKAALETAVASISPLPDVRTNYAEGTYGDGDEELHLPLVWFYADPCARPEGQTPERIVPLNIEIKTHYNDDYDRSALNEIYEEVRDTLETTSFDFGSNIVYGNNTYSIESPGTVEIDDNVNTLSFSMSLRVCATNFKWSE